MLRTKQNYLVSFLFVFIAALFSPSLLWAEADADRGAKLYKVCAACHGFKGEGNALVNAPGLADMPAWYVTRQINNFRHGIRGSGSDDAAGQTMAVMTGSLSSDVLVGDLVAYIGTLPDAGEGQVAAGDATRGQSLYAPCAACHGDKGQGNETLNAPGLAGMDAWYQVAQLKKFKSGQRGSDARDIYGQQMAPMAAVLVDDAAIADVVAYVTSLAQ